MKVRTILGVFILALTTLANAGGFFSLHQLPLRVVTSSYAQEYNTGFKNQYNPDGITGCAIGYGVTGCAFPGLSGSSVGTLALPDTSSNIGYTQFKIFIPSGTTSMNLLGHLPQNTQASFVLRFGSEPSRTSDLSPTEYSAARSVNGGSGYFSQIMASGQDVVVVHDGGGTVRLVIGSASISTPGWLYIRQIGGSIPNDYQGGVNVNLNAYAAGYRAITWDAAVNKDPMDPYPGSGSPISTEIAALTLESYTLASTATQIPITSVTPSSADPSALCTTSPANVLKVNKTSVEIVSGSVVSAQTSVAISCTGMASPVQVTVMPRTPVVSGVTPTDIKILAQSPVLQLDGTSTPKLSIQITPANADVGLCTVNVANTIVKLTATAIEAVAGGSVPDKTVATISCGTNKFFFEIWPKSVVTPAIETTESEIKDPLSLTFKFTPETGDVGTTGAKLFVVARIPGAFTYPDQDWYVVRTASGWVDLSLMPLDRLKFQDITPSTTAQRSVTVDLGVGKADATALKAEIYLWLLNASGTLKMIGKAWPQ